MAKEIFRTGFAMDGHKFSDNKNSTLKLCCMEFTQLPALDGESDGDVAAHALADAILMGCKSGDLGSVVGVGKNADNKGIGASGKKIIQIALNTARDFGYVLQNATVQIVAQVPKISPVAKELSQSLSDACGADVFVGATTLDGLGAIAPEKGDRSGIIALATVVLVSK